MRHLIQTIAVLLIASAALAEEPLWSSGLYDYDGAGNITAIGAKSYRYDGAGRLRHATNGADQQDYAYDVYGNLVSLTTRAGTATLVSSFAVDPLTNRLSGSCAPGADLCFEGRYDAAGNQTRRDQATTQPDEYVWDPLNAMAELQTLRRERYVYDADGERIVLIERLAGADVRHRYTLRGPGTQVARELTHEVGSGIWKLEKDYVYRGGALLASFSGPEAVPDRHYHVDHLGSPRLITDRDGFRVALHSYWPFGRETDDSDRDAERMKFTGHERDAIADSPGFDLDYMHARYYDPNGSRFLSLDPGTDWDPSQPQSWNLYTYVRNSPVGAMDPDGRQLRDDADRPKKPDEMFICTVTLGPKSELQIGTWKFERTLGITANAVTQEIIIGDGLQLSGPGGAKTSGKVEAVLVGNGELLPSAPTAKASSGTDYGISGTTGASFADYLAVSLKPGGVGVTLSAKEVSVSPPIDDYGSLTLGFNPVAIYNKVVNEYVAPQIQSGKETLAGWTWEMKKLSMRR